MEMNERASWVGWTVAAGAALVIVLTAVRAVVRWWLGG